jgi:hypothetical protein
MKLVFPTSQYEIPHQVRDDGEVGKEMPRQARDDGSNIPHPPSILDQLKPAMNLPLLTDIVDVFFNGAF